MVELGRSSNYGMKMKNKGLEVFTVSKEGLLASHFADEHFRGKTLEELILEWERVASDGEIKKVRLIYNDEVLTDTQKALLNYIGYKFTNDGEIEVTICFPEIQPIELDDLKVKQEEVLNELFTNYKEGKITELAELHQSIKGEMDSSDFKVFYIKASHILITHLGRLPRGNEKITKAELDNGGVKFTMVRV